MIDSIVYAIVMMACGFVIGSSLGREGCGYFALMIAYLAMKSKLQV
jgi:hypothetical protein